MLSKAQQLLLVLGLFVGFASADVDCSKRPPFVDPISCCTLPEFISDDVSEKCAQYNVTPSMPPPMSGEASGEGRHRHHHPPHPPPCFISCAFNETGILVDNKLDEDKLKEYLAEVFPQSSELQTATSEAFTTCTAKLDEMKNKMKDRPHPSPPPGFPKCPMRPVFLLGCVYKNVFNNCPASFWSGTQECNDMREHFENCKPPHRRPGSGEM